MAQYAEIISVVATPSPAPAGSRVDVVIKVRNLYSSPLTILSQYNCGSGGPQPYYVTQPDGTVDRGTVSPGQDLTVLGAFTMGDSDVTIYAYSWWYGSDGQYHFDDQKQITVSVQFPGQTYSARLDYIRLELEDGTQLSVSPLPTRPINTLAKVRVFATNTSTVKENIRAKVTVYGFDGLPLPDIYDNTSHGDFPYNGVSAGAQTQIVSSNLFGLTKPGTWTVHIDLLAGEGNLPGGPVPTQVVFSVDIPICTVPVLTGAIVQSQVSINGGAETNIPAGAVALGSSGAIHVTVKNTNTGSVRMKLVVSVKDATANNLTPTPVISPDIQPGGTHKLTSEQFKFNQTGSYTVEAKLYALPEEVTPAASLPATKLCNDVPAGQTDTATVNSLKIVGWGKLGGAISTSVVQLSPGDKLTVRVKINYSSPVADTTNSGTFAQLTYKRSELEKFVPVVGTTVTAPIPLPQALAPTDLTYDWTIPVGTGVESGQYDIKVGIPVTIGPGWADDTGNTFPIRVTTGSGGGMAEIPRDGLSIVSWGKKDSPLGNAALTLSPGDMLQIKVGIKYTSPADDKAVTNVGISYRSGPQIKHIDNEFISQEVPLPMSDIETTAYATFDIPIIGGADGGCYNGSYGITAIIPNPFPGWAIDRMDVLTVEGGSGNEQPSSTPLDMLQLVGVMVLMMVMSMVMSLTSELSAPGGATKAAKEVIQLVLPGGKYLLPERRK